VISDGGAPRIAAEALVRPRLIEALDRLLPLTVFRAPRGFGKTTAAAHWFKRLPPGATYWVSVERAGTTPTELWHLVDRSVGGPTGGPQDALRSVLEGPGGPVVLVIDDLDRVDGSDVVDDLLGLLRRFPRFHVVATARTDVLDPGLWLDLDGQVIGPDVLAFDEAEARDVLALLGIPDDVPGRVGRELGGWPLAVRAYGLARRDDQHGTAIARVTAQLGATVLAELGGEVDDLTLASALLSELDAADPAPVRVGDLDRLLATGLLVTEASAHGRRLRWPGVIRDMVVESVQRDDPGRVRRIRRDLVDQLTAAGDFGGALRQAAAAEEWSAISALVEGNLSTLVWPQIETLRTIFGQAPRGALGDGVHVESLYEMFFPDSHRARSLLAQVPQTPDQVARFVAESGPPPAHYDAVISVMWPFRLRGELESALRVVERIPAIRAAVQEAYPDHPNSKGAGVYLQCGLTWLHAGDVRLAVAEMELAHRHSGSAAFPHLDRDSAAKLALVHGFLGEHAKSRTWVGHAEATAEAPPSIRDFVEAALAGGRLYNAIASLDRPGAAAATAALEAHAHPREELWVLLQHARSRAAILWGHPAVAARELEQTAATSIPPAVTPFAADILLASRVDLAMHRGLGSRCAALLEGTTSTQPVVGVRRARLALLTGDPVLAASLARSVAEHPEASATTALDALVLEAVALQRADDPAAGKRLTQALTVAGRRIDAFAFVPREDLMTLARATPGAAALLNDPRLRAVADVFPATLSVVLLTQRELVILGHLAAGLTLPAIAHRETVSINTVKSQVLSIYRKLGASDRKHALEKAAHEGLV
jgi:LuxR family maltose regulon positive regulatory protein